MASRRKYPVPAPSGRYVSDPRPSSPVASALMNRGQQVSAAVHAAKAAGTSRSAAAHSVAKPAAREPMYPMRNRKRKRVGVGPMPGMDR